MTKLSLLLAQAAPAPSGPSSLLVQVAPLLLLFGAMYFLMIAPQRKKQKEHEKMMSALQAGDEIITTGGIYGTITSVRDDRFVVRVGDNNQKLEIGKSFVHSCIKKTGSAA